MSPHHAFLSIAVVACAIGAVIDLRTGMIPNWLTLGLLGLAPLGHGAVALVHGKGAAAAFVAVGIALLGAAGTAIVPIFLLRSGGLGMGDVKLFAAIGAASGLFAGLYAETYAYVVAMVYAVVLVVLRGKVKATLANVGTLLSRSRSAPRVPPLGQAALAADGIVDGVPAEAATANGDRGSTPDGHPLGFTEVRFGPAIFAGMVIATWALWRS